MGFFSRSKSNTENSNRIQWKSLAGIEEVDNVILASNNVPQVILKHSTRCGTSFFVKRNLDMINADDASGTDFHIIDVIADRSVSNYLSEKFEIRHESPQAFVLRDGAVVWHGSHTSVNESKILNALKE